MASFLGEFIAGIALTVIATVVCVSFGITICCLVKKAQSAARNAKGYLPPPPFPQQQQQQQQQPPAKQQNAGYQSLNVVTETRAQRLRNFFRRTPPQVPNPRDR